MKTKPSLRPSPAVALALAALAFALTGCVAVLPEPTRASGTKLSAKHVAFIHPGQTTRAEIEATLGTNHTIVQARPEDGAPAVLAYTWEGGLEWHRSLQIPFPWGSPEHLGSRGGWHAFLVALDPAEVVLTTGFKSLSSDLDLYPQVSAWALAQRKKH